MNRHEEEEEYISRPTLEMTVSQEEKPSLLRQLIIGFVGVGVILSLPVVIDRLTFGGKPRPRRK